MRESEQQQHNERDGAATINRANPAHSPRDRLILFLLFLTSDSCLEILKQHIPAERISFEMCRLWFDEIYVPGKRYMDGLKGDQNEEEVAAFSELFTDEELATLERFHAFLDLRLDMVSERVLGSRSFPAGDMWQNIVRDARYLVEDLEPDAERRRHLVDWLADLLARGQDTPLITNGRLHLGP